MRDAAITTSSERKWRGCWRGLALGASLILGACSSTPEWADPTALWDGVFGEEEDARPADAPVTASSSSFPTLSATPERPKTESAEERRAVADALIADRDNARYTDETLRAQTSGAVPVLRPAASPPAAAVTAARKEPEPEVPSRTPLAPPTAPESAKPETAKAETANTFGSRSGGLQSRAVSPDSVESRMQVPSIVQRRGRPLPPPTPIEEVARGRLPSSIVQSNQTPPPPSVERMPGDSESADRMDKAAMTEAMEAGRDQMTQAADSAAPKMIAPPSTAAATVPSTVAAATTAATTASTAMGASAMQEPMAASSTVSPAAMAAAVNVNLPVGQDQATLEQVFASQIAAQNSGQLGQRSVLPPTTVAGAAAGTAFPARPVQPATTYVGGTAQGSGGDNAGLRLPGAPLVVRFANSSSSLGPKGQRQVDEAARIARERGSIVRVVGHASQRTADMAYAKHKIVNFNVSLDRANAVARALSQRGVPRENIIVEAKGDEDPVFFEFMPNGEAYNRRVEIYLQ